MRVTVFAFLLCATLAGCESVPQPPPGPQGSSAANWSNDFLRAESGVIWVVNGTWTQGGKILFRDQQYTTDDFIQMLATQQGVSTNTPISILQEPGTVMPCAEAGKFYSAGYRNFRSLSLPQKYWRWWRRTHAQPAAASAASPRRST